MRRRSGSSPCALQVCPQRPRAHRFYLPAFWHHQSGWLDRGSRLDFGRHPRATRRNL